ncbi:MAG: aldehyde dehydrogenase family protein [Silvanigrellaceae bacterium]
MSQSSTSSDLSLEVRNMQAIQTQLKKSFNAGRMRGLEARLNALSAIERLVQENQAALCDAVTTDLGRPREDSLIAELSVVIEEARCALKNLKRWMKPKQKIMPLLLFPARGSINPEPFGVTLIIGPWNYPFQLLLTPLISALAAGNCAVIKPSELTPTCSRLIFELIPKYLSADVVQVVEGGVEITQRLLDLKWDMIFFTGSTQVGKVIAQAAARTLTPVVLELGGKSPCIVDTSADLNVTARRILWGKLLNSGQTCVAPDYIFTPRSNVENLVRALETTIRKFYPEGFVRNQSYCGIVNQRHFQRLEAITEAHRHQLRIGGKIIANQRLIEPSFYLLNINEAASAPIMSDEIFGPLTPIISYESIDEVTTYINAHDHPLALYVFSADKNLVSRIQCETRSGSFVVNDTVIHLATSELPFGGVGGSGMGAYHGEPGFQAFSYQRSIMKRPFWLDLPVRYRPYSSWKMWILRKLIGYR